MRKKIHRLDSYYSNHQREHIKRFHIQELANKHAYRFDLEWNVIISYSVKYGYYTTGCREFIEL